MWSELRLRQAYDHAIEFRGDLDLAAKPAADSDFEQAVNQRFLVFLSLRQMNDPCFINEAVAGSATATSAAIGNNSRYAMVDRGLHQGTANLFVNDMLRAVVFDKFDGRHGVNKNGTTSFDRRRAFEAAP